MSRPSGASRQQSPSLRPGPILATTGQYSLKLWCLKGLFRGLAHEWGLDFVASGSWPGLALVRYGVFSQSRLELQLQIGFLADAREFYDFSFTQAWRSGLGGRNRQSFCCGRLYPDDVLCEARVRRELTEKALLLGLATTGSCRRPAVSRRADLAQRR